MIMKLGIMDSWKYMSEGRGVWLSEELDSQVDGHGRCKNTLMGCEIKPFLNVENYPLVSNPQALERLDLMDLGFSDEIRKSYSVSSEPSGEVFSDEIGTDSYGNVVSPFGEERESVSRISTDHVQSNNQDFSLIDLKLGRFADGGGGATNSEFPKTSVPAPSTMSSLSTKRGRSTTLYPQPPCCQVLGCNKDLSSCKGYYKRHKVCDAHTKTAKVIVDGIEQRFCQQCSRFHLLAEFDDGKRSCRRRLAAHNKRRRKPQLTSESGARIIGFSSSFGFPDMLPSVIGGSGQGMSNIPAGVKDINVGMATSTTQKLSGIHQSSRALSLLSAQSHTMSSQLLGAAITSPRINKSSHAHSGFHAPGMYSTEADHVEPKMFNPHAGDTVDLKLPGHGISSVQDIRNNNSCHNPLGRGIILDLLQLSSHLQRVEQQKHSTESEGG